MPHDSFNLYFSYLGVVDFLFTLKYLLIIDMLLAYFFQLCFVFNSVRTVSTSFSSYTEVWQGFPNFISVVVILTAERNSSYVKEVRPFSVIGDATMTRQIKTGCSGVHL